MDGDWSPMIYYVCTHTGILGPGVNSGGQYESEIRKSRGIGAQRLETTAPGPADHEQEEGRKGIYIGRTETLILPLLHHNTSPRLKNTAPEPTGQYYVSSSRVLNQ